MIRCRRKACWTHCVAKLFDLLCSVLLYIVSIVWKPIQMGCFGHCIDRGVKIPYCTDRHRSARLKKPSNTPPLTNPTEIFSLDPLNQTTDHGPQSQQPTASNVVIFPIAATARSPTPGCESLTVQEVLDPPAGIENGYRGF